jgi:hypothetical protein
MFKNTRLSAVLAAVLFSVTAASALVSHQPSLTHRQQPLQPPQHRQTQQQLRPLTQQPLLQPKAQQQHQQQPLAKKKKSRTRTVSRPCGTKATSSTRAPSSSCR